METKPIIVEYLIIVLQEDTFCDSEIAFLKFLSIDSSLSISEKEKTITLLSKKKNKFSVSYSLTSGLVPSQAQRYFKLKLSSKEDKLNEYTELTTLLEKLISKLHKDLIINVLWNDIARKYAIEGYDLINQVENLLRRLITDFMLINVGYDWHKSHIPISVENRDTHLKETYSDYLHQTYFSDLKTILFEGQRNMNLRDIGQVQKFVETCISEKKTQILVDELKGVISKSLWEKYFSKDSTYKKKELEEDLEKLNSLRNEIAHNRHISRETLGKIQNFSKKVIKALKLEIEDLPNKVLTPEEQNFQVYTETNRIAEYNPALQGYLSEKAIVEWYKSNFGSESVQSNVKIDFNESFREVDIVITLNDNQQIGVEVKSTTISGFKQIRNQIAHGQNLERFIPKSVDLFKEFHLVIVLRDYSTSSDLIFANELAQLLSGINPRIKLIFGFLGNSGIFEQI
jgi:hypothetical protein